VPGVPGLFQRTPPGRYARPLAELVTLAFGPPFVVAEEFRSLDAVAVAIYESWAARYAGTAGHAPNDVDVDVLVIGDVSAAICMKQPNGPGSWRRPSGLP
jgi:hypothetical protein